MWWWTLRKLKSRDPEERKRAAWKLAESRQKRIVKPLAAALGDEDHGVRHMAAMALQRIGSIEAMKSLAAALQAKQVEVRQAAAEVLGNGGTQSEQIELYPPLLELLKAALRDEDRVVRGGAAGALGQIGHDSAVELLVAALGDEAENVRYCAGEALRRIGDGAREGLVAALGDERPLVRAAAVKTLGRIRNHLVVEPLVAMLQDRDGAVRQATAEALRELGMIPVDGDLQARTMASLIAMLHDEDQELRQAAAKALGRLTALPEDPALRTRAGESLTAALRDENRILRRKVAEALGQIGDIRAVEPLVAALEDEDSWVRGAAAEALGQIGDIRAVEPLVAALKDEDYGVRRKAVEALGQLGDVQAVKPLAAALTDENRWVQKAVVEVLGQIGNDQAVEPLLEALPKGHYLRPMLQVAEALGRIGMRLENPDLQARIAGMLAAILSASYVDDLYDDGYVDEPKYWKIIETLGQMGAVLEDAARRAAAVDALVELLSHPPYPVNPNFHLHLTLAVARIDSVRAVETLIAQLTSPHAEKAAMPSLLTILQREAGNLSPEVLLQLAHLEAVRFVNKQEVVVDCSPVKQLARQELSRRRTTTN